MIQDASGRCDTNKEEGIVVVINLKKIREEKSAHVEKVMGEQRNRETERREEKRREEKRR